MASIPPIDRSSSVSYSKSSAENIAAKGYALITLLVGEMEFNNNPPNLTNSNQVGTMRSLYTYLESQKAPSPVLRHLNDLINAMTGGPPPSLSDMQDVEYYLESQSSSFSSLLTPGELVQASCGKLEQAANQIALVIYNGGDQARLDVALSLFSQGVEFAKQAGGNGLVTEMTNVLQNLNLKNKEGVLLYILVSGDPTFSLMVTMQEFVYGMQANPQFTDPWSSNG